MKHLGLISILFVWAGLLFLIRRWKGDISMTFSQHAARQRAAQVYYFLLFAIELPLFTFFMFRWFIPEYNMPFTFALFLIVGTVGQFVAVVVPETRGWRVVVHRYAAFLMSDCLVVLNLLIRFSGEFSALTQFIAALASVVQVGIIMYLFKRRAYHPKILPIQATHIAMFHLVILTATYVG